MNYMVRGLILFYRGHARPSHYLIQYRLKTEKMYIELQVYIRAL